MRRSQAAVTPDSNSPSWLDAPMKIEFTALTRPLISSGVLIWTRVCRTTNRDSETSKYRGGSRLMIGKPIELEDGRKVGRARRIATPLVEYC